MPWLVERKFVFTVKYSSSEMRYIKDGINFGLAKFGYNDVKVHQKFKCIVRKISFPGKKMKPCYLFIGLFFISANFWLSGCSSNTITTEHPDKTVVLGHNSTNVEFRWMFTLKEKEEIKDVNVIRNVKYKATPKKTFLVRFDVDRNDSQLNSSLYTFTHNYTQGSLSGYFSFTIKDITKQEDNTNGLKFRYLSDELSYLLEIVYSNDVVRKESKIQLWISSLPRISYMTPHVYAIQGDSITLRCNASGRPAPRATWIHKDTNTVIAHSYVTSFNITGKASGGKYCCHVTNRGGDDTNCTSISVIEYQPINTKLISNIKFSTRNRTLKVLCKADASPPAKYFIQPVNNTRDNPSDGNVTITAPINGTSFNIRCIAKNKHGEGKPVYIKIWIYNPPEITNCLVNGTLSTSHPVFEGDVITVACSTSGHPSLTGIWTKDGRVWNGNELTFNPIYRADAGSYTFTLRTADNWKEAVQEVLITVHYLDDLEVIGSSNQSYCQSNPVVLFNLSVNAYPSNTTLSCNPSLPNTMTVITRHNVGFLVFVIINNGIESASIVCKAEHSSGTREQTLHYYKQLKAEEKTKVPILGSILAVSIVFNTLFIAVIIWLCRTKDQAHKGTRSSNKNEERQMSTDTRLM